MFYEWVTYRLNGPGLFFFVFLWFFDMYFLHIYIQLAVVKAITYTKTD